LRIAAPEFVIRLDRIVNTKGRGVRYDERLPSLLAGSQG